jgi:Zn-dependent membrane protease YugP
MTRTLSFSLALATLLFISACQSSHEQGVKSNYRAQWTPVNADTRATTEAARAVLNEQGLKDVMADSTEVDGKATGKKADGTKVDVSIERQGDNKSQVSVVVGTIGQPALGAEIARMIKDRAEGGTNPTMGTGTMTTPR